MVLSRQVNMTLGYFASTPNRMAHMTATSVYHTSSLIWIVPPGRAYTSLEKLAKPFQMIVWVCTLVVLVGSLIGAWIIKNRSIRIQNFILGDGVRDPCLNIFSVSLGGPVTKIPFGNFARTILAIFMIYCFIMQNSYKSALFKFMQMTIREPDISTTDELVQKGFKFYMFASSKAYLVGLPEVLENTVIVSPVEFGLLTNESMKPDFKGALLTSEDHLAFRNIKAYPDYFYHHAPEHIFTNNVVIYLNKHSCLVRQFDNMIIYLVNGGMFKNWASRFIDKNFLKQKSSSHAVPLTIGQLFGSFQVLVLGLIISTAAFGVEIILKAFDKKLKHKLPWKLQTL